MVSPLAESKSVLVCQVPGLVQGPLVATFPDGSRVNIPAGTMLREGEDPEAVTVTEIGDVFRAGSGIREEH